MAIARSSSRAKISTQASNSKSFMLTTELADVLGVETQEQPVQAVVDNNNDDSSIGGP